MRATWNDGLLEAACTALVTLANRAWAICVSSAVGIGAQQEGLGCELIRAPRSKLEVGACGACFRAYSACRPYSTSFTVGTLNHCPVMTAMLWSSSRINSG